MSSITEQIKDLRCQLSKLEIQQKAEEKKQRDSIENDLTTIGKYIADIKETNETNQQHSMNVVLCCLINPIHKIVLNIDKRLKDLEKK